MQAVPIRLYAVRDPTSFSAGSLIFYVRARLCQKLPPASINYMLNYNKLVISIE